MTTHFDNHSKGHIGTAHAATVSSRQVTLISNGESTIHGGQMFWNRNLGEMLRFGYNSVLIQDAERCTLVNVSPPLDDTIARHYPGWSTMRVAPHGRFLPPRHGDIMQALDQIGIQARDITDIIITPFQLYSTGTLLAFENARYHFSKRGWAHLHTMKSHPHDDRWRSFDMRTLGELVTRAWDRVHLLEDEAEVAPGLRAWWSGGHHRESIVVEIDSSIGVIAVSDTFFCSENVSSDIPIGLSENIYECLRAHARIRATAAHWVSVHDPAVFGVADAGIVRIA